jgi:alkanesulfonate monooxygenase SsuD/methylene tetrahydromethanopterin reductase-like flavin-dependent oxidoreductase (luciferase family)
VRAAADAEGMDGNRIKFFLRAMVFAGGTEEEARKRVSVEGGLARFSGLANVDVSVYPLN